MKKLFLFVSIVVLTTCLNSCSSSDDSTASTISSITLKIDGVSKTFNTIVVNQNEYNSGTADEYTELLIRTSETTPSEYLRLLIVKGYLGENVPCSFAYINNDSEYANYNGLFFVNTTVNGNNKIKGTFSGMLQTDFSDSGISITEGIFDIQY